MTTNEKEFTDTNAVANEDQQDKTVFKKSITAPKPVDDKDVYDKTVFAPRKVPNNTENMANTDQTVIASNTHRPKIDDLVGSDVDQTKIKLKNNKNTPENIAITEQAPQVKLLKGRFLLEDILGVGGMGVVYKAKDMLKVEAQDRDPYLAIKVLSEEFKTHPEAFISLQREAKKAQHIANQNTVKVYDFDRDGDVVFMTMEYMIGEPLDQMVKQYHATGLPKTEAWNILNGMCSALIHAHKEGIVHSDLKPGNIFITENGTAKIFDFGIARAVAKIDRSNNDLDRTVFDAGNLGALTPAYASREMLLGQVPDIRDDIYALGCIAYEILTGDHPFTRLPADEAYNKKLKPKRIQGIKKRHWKAIESALAFERKDRIASVELFYKQITEKKKSNSALLLGLALTVGAASYAYVESSKVEAPKISQAELMNQLEFKIRYQLLQENIERLITTPSFSTQWQASLWEEVQALANLFPEKPTAWYFDKRDVIYQLYLVQIKSAINTFSFTKANNLLNNAVNYTDDQSLLDQQKIVLEQNIAAKNQADNALAKNRRLAKIAQDKKAAQLEKANQIKKDQREQKKETTNFFNIAMKNVDQQLSCRQRLNMRDFKIAIEKLRSLDLPSYKKAEQKITTKLARCILTMGQVNPDYARDAKRYALLMFDNDAKLLSLVIKEKDGCQLSIAGLGAKGSRAVCKDAIKAGGLGPTMVVIPGNDKIKPFAMGKYEVSVSQYNAYCYKSKACQPIAKVNAHLPMTNISMTEISAYIKWLRVQTDKKYRLPTKREWLHAALSKNSRLDSNRNCQISTRGIKKGNELIKVTTGKQNAWGVVNSAGNAQEFVYVSGRKVAAVGGSYQTPMEKCTPAALYNHSGEADKYTGFRLIRDIIGS